jgi:hypothetical protein
MKGINDDVKADAKPADSSHVVTPKPDEATKPPTA